MIQVRVSERLLHYRAKKKADFFGYDAKRGTCQHIDNIEEVPFIKRCTAKVWIDEKKCPQHS